MLQFKKLLMILTLVLIFTESKSQNYQSLIGKWELQSIANSITKQNGITSNNQNKIKEKGTSITWEFSKNGKLLTKESEQTQEATWQLKGNQLIIKGNFGDQSAKKTETTELIYMVEQTNNILNLSVDATKMGPYKRHILIYTYQKL